MKTLNQLMAVLVLSVLFFSACESGENHEGQALNMDSVKAKIAANEKAYQDASNAHNAEGVAAYYAADAESMAPDEPTRVGHDAILAAIQKDVAADTSGGSLALATTGLWAAGNYATETGTWTAMDKSGKVTEAGKFMTLFEMRDGKYIAIRDIWNSDSDDDDEAEDGAETSAAQ